MVGVVTTCDMSKKFFSISCHLKFRDVRKASNKRATSDIIGSINTKLNKDCYAQEVCNMVRTHYYNFRPCLYSMKTHSSLFFIRFVWFLFYERNNLDLELQLSQHWMAIFISRINNTHITYEECMYSYYMWNVYALLIMTSSL